MSNKVIELADRFLCTWLDSDGTSVWVMLGVYRYDFTEISKTMVAPAENNHGGASMAIDSAGYLHIVYGPHGNPMRYRRSSAPNDFVNFTAETRFGTYLTYPSLFVGSDDTLYMTAREGTGELGAYGGLDLWEKRPGGSWAFVSKPLINRALGYAAFNASLFIDTANRMHVGVVFHEGTSEIQYGAVQSIAYAYSDDFGRTWKSGAGNMPIPATLPQTEVIYEGGLLVNTVVGNGSLAVDATGVPRMLVSVENARDYSTNLYLASRTSQGWRLRDLLPLFRGVPAGYSVSDAGIVVPLADGRLRIVVGLQKIAAGERDPFAGVAWGHRSNTIYTGVFSPNDSFINMREVPSQADGNPRWLVNIAHPTRQGQAVDPKVAIYTHGPAGGGYSGGGAEIWARNL